MKTTVEKERLPQTEFRFDGDDYVPERDDARLTGQLKRIFDVMSDWKWHTLRDISVRTNDPEASISAQLRHLRKKRFGAYTLDREYIQSGLYRYRVADPEEPGVAE
jgi:hypothetical protein